MTNNEETITIPKRLYDILQERFKYLAALAVAGVDNWEGFEHAQEIYAEWNKED